jgi:glycosyltransferase involved in cell wall biosynthesis
MKVNKRPYVAGVVIGDIFRELSAQVKYGFFFEAIKQQLSLVSVYDATLRGKARLFNALLSFHPNRRQWRERFYKNLWAFGARSRHVAAYLKSVRDQVDVVLQVGVLFDACWGNTSLPNVIYTDYTAHLTAQKKGVGRSPFTARQRERWIALERQAFEHAAHICTRSELVRHSILTEYGIEPKKVTVVGGGVNFPKLPELKRQDEKDNAPTVLFIGKEFYRKGGDLLLRAFAQARAWAPEARLLLLTQDTINGNLPLEGVEVIKPTWDRAFIASLYRQADLFVLPSRLETWGDVLLEAMAYELPCIGVAGEAMEEIIQDGRNGLIVPPNNVEALANALIRLLNDARLRYEWGQAARQCVEKKYTWDRVAERVAPIIEVAAARQSFSERKEICYSLSKLS